MYNRARRCPLGTSRRKDVSATSGTAAPSRRYGSALAKRCRRAAARPCIEAGSLAIRMATTVRTIVSRAAHLRLERARKTWRKRKREEQLRLDILEPQAWLPPEVEDRLNVSGPSASSLERLDPVVGLAFGGVLLVAVPRLKTSEQLILLAGDELEI